MKYTASIDVSFMMKFEFETDSWYGGPPEPQAMTEAMRKISLMRGTNLVDLGASVVSIDRVNEIVTTEGGVK